MSYIYLSSLRIPDYPSSPVALNTQPLQVLDTSTTQASDTIPETLTPSTAIATILHTWCPTSLLAFLDLDAWFSFTWILSTATSTIEIGRVGTQITFGTLDAAGDDWTLMLTFNIVPDGPDRGKWVPNTRESMRGEEDVTEPAEIERLARDVVRTWVVERIWETGKGVKHRFYVEYAPMDVWGDGIAMNPHWLYEALSLSRCSWCARSPGGEQEVVLSRCGKCGTATYCSSICQRRDWAVHKHICSLSLEDRGQMLRISENGGLVGWDVGRVFAALGSGEESKNPNLVEGTLKRSRDGGGVVSDEQAEE